MPLRQPTELSHSDKDISGLVARAVLDYHR